MYDEGRLKNGGTSGILREYHDTISCHGNTTGQVAMNARQFFQNLMATAHDMTGQPVPKEQTHGKAPEEPNVYADGSHKQPKSRYYGLLGYGVFWPNRTGAIQPTTEDECAISDGIHTNDKGMMLYGQIKGLRGSSTRAEIAAVILAMCGAGPIHVASDNKNVVNAVGKMRTFLQDNAQRKAKGWKTKINPLGKPFRSINDGDLLHELFRRVEAKGYEAVQATWVRGHATSAHIAEGRTTLEHKLGNDAADTAADDGVGAHGVAIIEVSRLLADRQHAYAKFTSRIQRMIVRVREAEKQERTRRELDRNPFGKKPRILVKLPVEGFGEHQGDNSLSIPMAPLPEDIPAKLKHIQLGSIKQTWVFVNTLKFTASVDNTDGFTWLELLALANYRGVSLMKIINETSAASLQLNTDQSLEIFKATIRWIANHCMSSLDKMWLTGHTSDSIRLEPFGYDRKIPAIRAVPITSDEEALHVQMAILETKRKMTTKLHQKAREQGLMLMVGNPRLWGTPPWLKRVSETAPTDYDQAQLRKDGPRPGNRLLKCPQCRQQRDTRGVRLRTGAAWNGLKCSRCKVYFPSKLWECLCNKEWFMCNKHNHPAYDVKTKSQGKKEDRGQRAIKQPIFRFGKMPGDHLFNEAKRHKTGSMADKSIIQARDLERKVDQSKIGKLKEGVAQCTKHDCSGSKPTGDSEHVPPPCLIKVDGALSSRAFNHMGCKAEEKSKRKCDNAEKENSEYRDASFMEAVGATTIQRTVTHDDDCIEFHQQTVDNKMGKRRCLDTNHSIQAEEEDAPAPPPIAMNNSVCAESNVVCNEDLLPQIDSHGPAGEEGINMRGRIWADKASPYVPDVKSLDVPIDSHGPAGEDRINMGGRIWADKASPYVPDVKSPDVQIAPQAPASGVLKMRADERPDMASPCAVLCDTAPLIQYDPTASAGGDSGGGRKEGPATTHTMAITRPTFGDKNVSNPFFRPKKIRCTVQRPDQASLMPTKRPADRDGTEFMGPRNGPKRLRESHVAVVTRMSLKEDAKRARSLDHDDLGEKRFRMPRAEGAAQPCIPLNRLLTLM